MYVRDLLRSKGENVVTVRPDASVTSLLETLAKYNIGALVVSRNGKSVDGIVSERDVVRALVKRGGDLMADPVSSIMTAEVTTANPGSNLEKLMRTVTEQRIRHLPVVIEGDLSGIISIGDLVKARIDELEMEKESLIGYIRSSG